MNLRLLIAAGLGACLALGAAVQAQPSASPLAPLAPAKGWQALSPQQQQVLAPLSAQWSRLSSDEREQWLALAARYPSMQGEDQVRFRARLQDWAQMSPSERLRARQGFQGAQRVTAAEREAKWAAYQQLPAEKRQALQARAAQRASAKPEPSAASVTPVVRPGVSSLQPGQRSLAAAPWAPSRNAPRAAPAPQPASAPTP